MAMTNRAWYLAAASHAPDDGIAAALDGRRGGPWPGCCGQRRRGL